MRTRLTLFPSLADFFAPGVCPFCGEDLQSCEFVCEKCLHSFERVGSPMCPICGIPFYEGHNDHLCLDCATNKPPFDMARSAVLYKGSLANMVWQLKYKQRTWVARALASFMNPDQLGIKDEFEIVTAVPQTKSQMLERGHNQAVDLAVAFCELYGFKEKLCLPALTRIKWTKSQVGLSKAEREKNVQGAFLAKKEFVYKKRVLLIDDIITTGATCKACASALKRAGAEEVVVVSFARSTTALDPTVHTA